MTEQLSTKIWQYAKRQITWFKRDKKIQWFAPTDTKQIFDAVNNEPVVGAKVILARENGEELAYFITEEDGSYTHLNAVQTQIKCLHVHNQTATH